MDEHVCLDMEVFVQATGILGELSGPIIEQVGGEFLETVLLKAFKRTEK